MQRLSTAENYRFVIDIVLVACLAAGISLLCHGYTEKGVTKFVTLDELNCTLNCTSEFHCCPGFSCFYDKP